MRAQFTPRVEAMEVRQKTYYGRRLLELGPLPYAEFRDITGWAPEVCEAVLSNMRRNKIAQQINGVWRLK